MRNQINLFCDKDNFIRFHFYSDGTISMVKHANFVFQTLHTNVYICIRMLFGIYNVNN